MLDSVLLWIDKNEKRWLADVKSWLNIPSVSAQPDHDADVRRAAEWAHDQLRTLGMNSQIVATPKHPCVLATTPDELCEPGAPHILYYGHYDVQPAEPLDLWETPAFTATVKDGKLIARGACDDKGQVHCHIAALTAWKEINHKLPCRVTMLLEGEEEIGSPSLMGVVNAHAEFLKTAKTLIISDSSHFAQGVPAINYGLRGLVYFQITLKGANTDLHSGVYGGSVANPANALVEVLGKLHNMDGQITIPDFYNDVVPLTKEEKDAWATLPFTDEAEMKELGVHGFFGEAGYSTLPRRWVRPTLEINGLTSGYQGPGAKTVLPCVASAKVSCRLVPDQQPHLIAAAFKHHVKNLVRQTFGNSIQCEIEEFGAGSPPALTPIKSQAMSAAAEAVEIGFGKLPVFTREGGSIPVVTWFKDALGLDTVMLGFGLPTDKIHAPNEKLDLVNYFGGIKTAAALYDRLAKHYR